MNLFYEINSDLGASQCFWSDRDRTMIMKWVKVKESGGGFF
jgi:hypothetical protein